MPMRTAAPVVARAAPRDEDEIEPNTGDVELVSLEDAEVAEGDKDVTGDEDVDLGEVAGDDTFLEEEEENEDDVSGLIDGDIEDEEEG